MGDLREFSVPVRLFLRAYRWRRIDPLPWTPLSKPLDQCRVALISSAGLVPPDLPRFDPKVRGGDSSHRWIPAGTDPRTLVDCHRSDSFDHSGITADANLAFPLDRIAEYAAAGRIGSQAPRHLSFMGSLTATGRLRKESAPEAARGLLADGVEVALLVPV